MMTRGRLARIVLAAFVVGLVCSGAVSAETITQTFEHSLGVGTSAQSWEHRIDLPEGLAMKGRLFTERNLKLVGKLVIEREELKGNYYYVKVRLPKAWMWVAKGNLTVTLFTGCEGPATPVLDPCEGLRAFGYGTTPKFSWTGAGKFTAVSLLDRTSAQTVWERVIVGRCDCDLDEGSLKVGGHYYLAAKQSDETGRYSAETKSGFRVDVRNEKCTTCNGAGWTWCGFCGGSGHHMSTGPNGQPIYTICGSCNGSGRQRCTFCSGTGYTQVPIVVNE